MRKSLNLEIILFELIKSLISKLKVEQLNKENKTKQRKKLIELAFELKTAKYGLLMDANDPRQGTTELRNGLLAFGAARETDPRGP